MKSAFSLFTALPLFFFFSLAGICRADETMPLPMAPWQQVETVNGDWRYLEKDQAELPDVADAGWTAVTLPHTWNAKDTLETAKYRRAASWYSREFSFTEADLKKRLFLRFGAAGQKAIVFINGKKAAEHAGGYSAFTVELTGLVAAGKNQVAVWVSNKHDPNLAPLSGDFNMYGGLYRSVQLLRAPALCLGRKTLGGPGIRVWSEKVSAEAADLNVVAQVDNGEKTAAKVTVRSELVPMNADRARLETAETTIEIPAGQTVPVKLAIPKIERPQLWSPESPQLYTLTVRLLRDGKEIDRTVVRHGFRWFEFTADRGFFLNGQPYKLRGANRHQDFRGEGNALALARHWNDLKLLKEVGINWLRLAHYQQDDYVLQLCDELGILAWEEIPYVNGTTLTPEFDANLQSMMRDMIEQHFNHPAIIVWGMGNEVWLKKNPDDPEGKAKDYPYFLHLNELVHREDSVRKTVIVSGDINTFIDMKIMTIPDLCGYNLYRGWYGAGYESFTTRVNDLRQRLNGKPLVISEFGAGADTWIHSETPKRFDFSEEYQILFIQSHLDQMEQMPWLCGFNWWIFADFGAAHRTDTNPHINNKGWVTFDRQKKDSFYYLQARWTKTPVVYLASPAWKERTGKAEKEYQVFSNCGKVELFHNGKSLGAKTAGFRWPVTLVAGENTLLAKGWQDGKEYQHGFTVRYAATTARYTATASAEKGDEKAECAVDGNPATRWSAEGNAWLKLDLGRIALVESVEIGFHKGTERHYKLTIELSSDDKKWTQAFAGQSNGEKASQAFAFPQAEARYVRISGQGNNQNGWNSYSEVSVKTTTDKKEKLLYEKIGQ